MVQARLQLSIPCGRQVALGGRSTYDSGPRRRDGALRAGNRGFGGLSAQAGQVTPAVAFVLESGPAAGLAPLRRVARGGRAAEVQPGGDEGS